MYFKNLCVDKKNKRITGVVETKLTEFEKLDFILRGEKPKTTKAFIATCSESDDFDIYTGAALVLAQAMFGSKSQFRKWVDQNATIVLSKEDKAKLKKEKIKKAKTKAKTEQF